MLRKMAGPGLSAILFLALPGCVIHDGDVSTGETVTDSRVIELSKARGAERVNVNLEIGAGELRVIGGAQELLEGEFTYNVAKWKPTVEFDKTGLGGNLLVKQGGEGGSMGNTRNQWRLRLNDSVPMNFSLKCGAGENRLSLGSLDLRDVEVNIGAGRVELDLRGKVPEHDYSVRINGGVGEAEVRLPSDAGIEATASGGLGEIEVHGLEKQGNEWRNSMAGKGKGTIRVDVHGGIGHISIDAR